MESRAATLFPRHSRKMKGNNTMNTQLIPTVSGQLDNQTQTLVNAKDLHEFLGVETKFRDWIKRRIADYGFTQAVDFCEISNLSNRGFWPAEGKDYLLSVDMAKELCMVERNDKGRQARRYFIEMEKWRNRQKPCPMPYYTASMHWKTPISKPRPKCSRCCATAVWA